MIQWFLDRIVFILEELQVMQHITTASRHNSLYKLFNETTYSG